MFILFSLAAVLMLPIERLIEGRFDTANKYIIMSSSLHYNHRDDNDSFINETLLRVRTCCIDEIKLTFKALTNHSPS